MRIDLHTHSTASDGQFAPEQVVELAKQAGVEVLALTDHDTVSGVPAAVEAGKELGIQVIPGIELSAAEYPNLHILGYGIDVESDAIQSICHAMQKSREDHNTYIVDFLHRHGIPIDLEEVQALAGRSAVGRPHFAQVMVCHGWVKTSREAFEKYLDTPEYLQVEREKFPAKDCIAAILAAGGNPVMAHPYQLRLENGSLEKEIKKLVSYGLAGLECYYPKHTSEQQAFYLKLAEKYGLYVTAGNDFHGEKIHPSDTIRPVDLDVSWLTGKKGKSF